MSRQRLGEQVYAAVLRLDPNVQSGRPGDRGEGIPEAWTALLRAARSTARVAARATETVTISRSAVCRHTRAPPRSIEGVDLPRHPGPAWVLQLRRTCARSSPVSSRRFASAPRAALRAPLTGNRSWRGIEFDLSHVEVFGACQQFGALGVDASTRSGSEAMARRSSRRRFRSRSLGDSLAQAVSAGTRRASQGRRRFRRCR